MKTLSKNDVIKMLALEPLSVEGGFFRQVYKAALPILRANLPPRFKAKAYTASTSIYYLLGAEDFSRPHAVAADETWHFYRASHDGVFIELTVISPEGDGRIIEVGPNFESGQCPQFTVPAGHWMCGRLASRKTSAAELQAADAWALAGATVAPSFEYEDFTEISLDDAAALCPKLSDFLLGLKARFSDK